MYQNWIELWDLYLVSHSNCVGVSNNLTRININLSNETKAECCTADFWMIFDHMLEYSIETKKKPGAMCLFVLALCMYVCS